MSQQGLRQGVNPGKEHDTSYAVCLYKTNMRGDLIEFGDLAGADEQSRHKLRMGEREAAYKKGEISTVRRIDLRRGRSLSMGGISA